MSRALYVGGFGNGKRTAEKVGEALSRHYEAVDTFTFAQAMNSPETIERWSRGADVVVHSAGRMAVQYANPDYLHTFNAPKPTSRSKLLARTGLKMAVMHSSVRSVEGAKAVAGYDASAAAELTFHPVGNLRPFIKGQISAFDGVKAARLGVATGTPETFVVTDHDLYFKHSEEELAGLTENGVHVVSMNGQHDELGLRPQEVLDHYFSVQAR